MAASNPSQVSGEYASTRVLVLGATGMLGHAVLRLFAESPRIEVVGTARSAAALRLLPASLHARVKIGVDVEQFDSVVRAFGEFRPNAVINCVGVVKQLAEADDPLQAIPINSLLPHRLARLSAVAGARLVHISTDCVFSGTKGMYREEDVPDAADLYGRSKLLGEVDYPNAVTLRTSIIGHELGSAQGLVGWFLAQQGMIRGFRRAVFSGLPTVELARLIRDLVLPDATLRGTYHVSADPIDKLSLLQLVRTAYDKTIDIVPDEELVIDRSLDSSRFRSETGYKPMPWGELVAAMKAFG